MAGGIFEGIKKCYKGKNALRKHLFILVLSLLISIPSAIATLNTNGDKQDVYKYLYIEHWYLGLVVIAASIILGIFMIHFIHNCVKYFLWKDTQRDESKIEAMEILPEVDLSIFKHFWSWVGFWVIWMVTIFISGIILGILCAIPLVNFVGIPIMLIYISALLISMPYITVGFARNYTIKGNVSPLLLFTYIPKILIPAVILDLKYLGVSFLYGIGIALTIIVFVIIEAAVAPLGKQFWMSITPLSIITTSITYFASILGLAYYYAAAKIYYDKVELEKEF